MSPKNGQGIAITQMVICAALWSIAGILFKLIDWNPFVIAGFRSLIAAVTVFLYMRAARLKLVITKKSLITMFFLAATFLCFVSANKLTTAANAIVLEFTSPIFIMILSAVFLRQRFRVSDIITALLTFGGISLFCVGSLGSGQLLGNLIAVASGVTMAVMYITTGRATENERMSGILLGQLLTALIGIPFCFFTKGTVTLTTISYIFILGIFQLGIPYILLGLASSKCPPLACSLIAAIEPLLNPVWVFIFNGEHPGPFAIAGGVIVISAVTAQCVLQYRYSRACISHNLGNSCP